MQSAAQREAFERVLAELTEPFDPSLLGPQRRIHCYRTRDGRLPAREFLESLPREARASYAKSFEKYCQGHQLRGEKHHVWTEKGCEGLGKYEGIPSKSRVLHVFDRFGTVVLLFGFGGKKEDKVAQHHVNEAQRLRDEYRRRRDARLLQLAARHGERR